MWLQALLTADDLFGALSRVTPARVSLDKEDPDRFLWVSKPERLRLIHGRSIVLDARASIRWDVLGLSVPLTLKHVSLSLSPTIQQVHGQDVLSFRIQLEEADLSGVPAFVEKTLVERVNEALVANDAKMAWRFLETLDFEFRLPVLAPQRRVSLYARSATAEVTDRGLSLTVAWGLDAAVVAGQEALRPPDVVAEGSPDRQEPVGGPRPPVA
jgi:hypothetical protein